MTPLGRLIFGVIGLLFIGGIAAAIWWGLSAAGAVRDKLGKDGWKIEPLAGGGNNWIARGTTRGLAATIEVRASGARQRRVQTSVRLPLDTGKADVLVTPRMPGFLASDGALAAALGFAPPPRWAGGTAAFRDACDAFASEEQAALRWLPEASQTALVAYNRGASRPVSIRFFDGAIEARVGDAPESPQQLDALLGLLVALREPVAAR